jgi:hypothetical protein
MANDDHAMLVLSDRILDGLYAFKKQGLILGRDPS